MNEEIIIAVSMTLPRIKSTLLVAVGAIVGSLIVLFLHWAWKPPHRVITKPALTHFSSVSTTSRVDRRNITINSKQLGIDSNKKFNNVANVSSAQSTDIMTMPDAVTNYTRSARCHGQSFQLTADKLILYHAICNISNGNDIAQFSGHSMSHLFDKGNTKLHYTINEKLRMWREVATQLNHTQSIGRNQSISSAAVHMHNTHKLGDFMLLFWTEYFRFGPNGKNLKKGKDVTPLTSAQFKWAMEKNQPPVVITNWGDENWGHLSARKMQIKFKFHNYHCKKHLYFV